MYSRYDLHREEGILYTCAAGPYYIDERETERG